MSVLITFFTFLLALIEILYLRLAGALRIHDLPNARSSHKQVTPRGGGIIFPFAWLFYSFWNGFAYPWFTAGLVLVASISFADDLRPIPARVRLGVHLIAFTLCFMQLDVFTFLSTWQVLTAYIVCIGIVNAFNFMDGINGITGLYALALATPLMFCWGDPFGWWQPDNPFPFLIASIVVFGFFNFRKTAVCFAGDVGSISLGFIMLFFLLTLFFGLWVPGGVIPAHSNRNSAGIGPLHWAYFLMLALYGIDVILTIVYRIWRRENIFKAHRLHLYQFLANECRWPHLLVAGLYAGIQTGINWWVLHSDITRLSGLSLLIFLTTVYFTLLAIRRGVT